jgi:hypothetical protein
MCGQLKARGERERALYELKIWLSTITRFFEVAHFSVEFFPPKQEITISTIIKHKKCSYKTILRLYVSTAGLLPLA